MWTRDPVQENPARTSQPKPVPTAPPAPAQPIEERRVVAWLGKSLLFRGDLIGLEDMIVDGRVEGTIELRDNALTIGPDAFVQADITAKFVTINGEVVGSVTATDTICIGATGRVEGNITSRRLSMADGAMLKGQVMTGGSRGDATPAPERQLDAAV